MVVEFGCDTGYSRVRTCGLANIQAITPTRCTMLPRNWPFNGGSNQNRFIAIGRISGNCELAFLGNAFERFGGVLDPILAVVTVGRKQADHLVGSARSRTCDIAGGKIDSLSNAIFMLQRPLHHAKRQLAPKVPLASAD